MKNRISVLILALTLIASALALSACGGDTGGSDIQSATVKGRHVFVHDSNILFFGYNNYLCSAKYENGEVSEIVVEAGMTADIYSVAVYDHYLYTSNKDGFFRYPLDAFSGSGTMSAEVVSKDSLSYFQPFEIYDDNIYFIYGYDLNYVPVTGGERTKIAADVKDFEVTDNGIYYVRKDGKLRQMSLDFADDKEIGELEEECLMQLDKETLYYRDGDDLKTFDLQKAESAETETENDLSSYCVPWPNNGSVMYEDEHFDAYIVSEGGEKPLGDIGDFPDKANGFIYDGHLLFVDNNYKELVVINMTDGTSRTYDLASELAESLNGSGSASSGGSGGTSAGGTETSGAYDILKGTMKEASDDGSIAYLFCNGFMLTMPNNSKWGYEKTSSDTLRIYLIAADQAGVGGNLVTIKAYDPDDTSYEEIPSYHVAGFSKSLNKRFIAIYPTDVQWDHSDAGQEADYRELQEYLQKIGEGAVNSPLTIGDN